MCVYRIIQSSRDFPFSLHLELQKLFRKPVTHSSRIVYIELILISHGVYGKATLIAALSLSFDSHHSLWRARARKRRRRARMTSLSVLRERVWKGPGYLCFPGRCCCCCCCCPGHLSKCFQRDDKLFLRVFYSSPSLILSIYIYVYLLYIRDIECLCVVAVLVFSLYTPSSSSYSPASQYIYTFDGI